MSRIAVSTKRIPTSAALRWMRLSRFERVYELRDEIGAAYGHVRFERLVGRNATAQIGGTNWRLNTTGVWRPKTRIFQDGGLDPIAVFERFPLGWAGRGTLSLNDGTKYFWSSASLFSDRRWHFIELPARQVVIAFRRPILRQAGMKDLLMAEIQRSSAPASDDVAGLLTALGMYLLG